jgi:HK97 family phage portal protein
VSVLSRWLSGQQRSPSRKSEAKSLASPEAWFLELFGATPALSGVAVTPRTAMTCAPVRCAVQTIAEAVGQLPVHVHARKDDGSKERAPDHPAHQLLHGEANEWTPASGLREQVTRDALLYRDGGFAFINRVDGRPVELLRLDPERMTVKPDPVTGEPTYAMSNGTAAPRMIARQDVLHIPSPSLTGRGLVHDGREAIGLALTMEAYAARLFGNGARPSGVISFKGNITPEGLTKAKEAWQAAHGGAKSGGTAVIPGEASWSPITLTSVDAQFLELRKFAIEEIARLFRVPPIFLMEFGRATWSNSEEMGRQFITFCLLPWIKRWEGEIRLKLFAPEERDTYVAEFLVDDFLRADFAARMEGYAKAIAARILNPNEARSAENRPAYAGGDKFENPNTTVRVAA